MEIREIVVSQVTPLRHQTDTVNKAIQRVMRSHGMAARKSPAGPQDEQQRLAVLHCPCFSTLAATHSNACVLRSNRMHCLAQDCMRYFKLYEISWLNAFTSHQGLPGTILD